MKKRITYILFLFCALLFSQHAGASLIDEDKKATLSPELDSIWNRIDSIWIGGIDLTYSIGTDYWATFLPNNGYSTLGDRDPKLRMSIHAVADTAVIDSAMTIIIEVNGVEKGRIELTDSIPEGTAIFGKATPSLPEGETENIIGQARDVYINPTESNRTLPKGVHIYAADYKTPFACYVSSEAGLGRGSSQASAFLLPTRVLGNQYNAQTYEIDTKATEFAVIATEDNTTFIYPDPDSYYYNPDDPDATPMMTYTIPKKGGVFMLRKEADIAEGESASKLDTINLSGSFICADKPIAVFQGNEYVQIARANASGYSGNHMFNQAFPITQTGKEFYLGLAKPQQINAYGVLAMEDNTTVNITGKPSRTMQKGESYYDWIYGTTDFIKISADKPVLVTSYLTSGGTNKETTEDFIDYLWGNPTSANVVPWERRVKEMPFYTYPIELSDSATGQSHTYVQVVIQPTDINKITLDGVNQRSKFTIIREGKAFANIELNEPGMHTLKTTGEGFVGFVYGITSEARAYQYTLGLSPKPLYDSLYVTNEEEIMDSLSYNLKRIDGKGWYQRQWNEWLPGSERLDKAVVCDSAEVGWSVEMPIENPVDSIKWTIYNVTKGAKIERDTIKVPLTAVKDTLLHTFELPEEQMDVRRHNYFDYEIHAVLYRLMDNCVLSEGDTLGDIDTLKTTVRVWRIFNDTIRKIICAGDTFSYFLDDTIIGPDTIKYSTKFYFDEAYDESGEIASLPDYKKYQYHTGFNTITRTYKSQGGCDSLRTLRFYVCDPVRNSLDTTVCQDDLQNFQAYLKDFFNKNKKINFESTFAAREKDTLWKQSPDDGSWYLKQTDTLKTLSCLTEELELFNDSLKDEDKFEGCDSTLALKLRVMPVTIHRDTISSCAESYTWEVNGKTTVIDKTDENYNTPFVYKDTIPYAQCPDCSVDGCDSVRYELKLMFVDTVATDTIHLCQNDEPYVHPHPDGRGGTAYWPEFDPRGKAAGIYPLDTLVIQGNSDEDCTYSYLPIIVVDSVTTYRDSVVICYDGRTKTYTWPGHPQFWYHKKGESTNTLAPSITVTPSKEELLIYELSDQVLHQNGDCDTMYYQTLIFMPDYKVSSEKHMADDDVYIWDGKILAGDKATEYENPDNLDVYVMTPERTDYPENWTVTYNPSIKEYTIINATKTVPIYDIDGNEQRCDSVDTLHLRIGQKFESITYEWTCSDTKTYRWRDKDRTIPQGLGDTTIYFYDSLQTKWPVIGLDSVYVLSLTVFPYYRDTIQDTICQTMDGYQWIGHKGDGHDLYIDDIPMDPSWDSIPANLVGHFYITDKMETQPRIFINPETGAIIDGNVQCDSIWVLDLIVNPTYDSIFTKIGGDTMVVKSNDTATYFMPKTLFIGSDFDYAAHGNKTPEELKAEAGADTVVFLPNTDALHFKTFTSQYGCDSTVYKFIEICKLQESRLSAIIGDNDTEWTFGGDTIPDAYGVKEHTQPLVSGSDFHVDDDGNPIDYKSDGRPVRKREYVDTLHTVNGCDSIVHMSLTIYPAYQYDTAATTCHNQKFDWREHTDLHLKGPDSVLSIISDTINYRSKQSGGVVDSMYILHLTIRPGILQHYSKNLCYNDTLSFYGRTIIYNPIFDLDSAVVEYRDPNDECGNVYILYPTFNPSYGYDGDPNYKQFVDSIDMGICQNEDFQWFDKNGKEHTVNLRDAEGNKYTSVPTEETGWHILYDSLKTESCNCDSIYTLHYYVDRSYHYDTDTAICPGVQFVWTVKDEHGNTYTKDTVYSSEFTTHIYDTIHGQTTHGCDSSYYLHIFVDQPYKITIDTVICFENQHFEWRGNNGLINYDEYIEASHYMTDTMQFHDRLDTFTVRAGCDSVMILNLVIAPSPDSIWTDTICTSETYRIYEQAYTTAGEHIFHRPNEWGCDVTYKLTLDVFDPTQFTVQPEQICVNDAGADNTYTIRYTYQGKFQPIMYSVRYDSLALDAGFENQDSIAIDEILVAGKEYELYIPTPAIANKEDYPRPDFYHALLAFENGVCLGDSLMTYEMVLQMNYPNWLMEQRHGDVIALLNEQYNGGYTWTEYQWYEGDQKLIGQTKPYLHIPTGLTPGAMYHVELTRTNDSIVIPTCEIEAIANPIGDDYAPTRGYLSVTPTCVVTGHPIIYILSRKDGTYRISSLEGQLVSEGVFHPDVTEVTLPTVTGMYIVQLWSNDTPEEPYRAIKVLVREQCPNCDTSF